MANADAARALLKTRYCHSDIYVGSPLQLCAAGLVRTDQLPGLPGMAKVRATYFLTDGVPVPHGCSSCELTFCVERISSARYSVSVDVCDEEVERRKALIEASGELPLDLPGAAAAVEQKPPAWTPSGWSFRRWRISDERYVFVASIEQLKTSGLMGDQPLPVVDGSKRKRVSFCSERFGWVSMAQRSAGSFFVFLHAPREIRFADYQVTESEWAVTHKGTKEQLHARGLGVGLGFPGEPGCNRRKVTTFDSQTGAEVCFALLSRSEWCGDVPRFEVTAQRSEGEKEAFKRAKRVSPDAIKAKRDLAAMPKSAQDFRLGLIDSMRSWIRAVLAGAISPPEWHGYTLDSDAVEEIHASFDAVVEAIAAAPVKFDPTVHAQVAQQYRAAIAAADKPFQAQVAALARPNLQILGGVSQ